MASDYLAYEALAPAEILCVPVVAAGPGLARVPGEERGDAELLGCGHHSRLWLWRALEDPLSCLKGETLPLQLFVSSFRAMFPAWQ